MPSDPERAASVMRASAARVAVLVALGAQPLELGELAGAHGGVVDPEHLDRLVLVDGVAVDADDRLLAGVDAGLGAGRGLLDAHLGDAGLDRLGHAAGGLDLLDVLPGALARGRG